MKFRKIIFELHKILGLISGVVVFIVAITGCCWVFKEELQGLNDDYKKVVPQDKPVLTVSEAKMLAQEVFPDKSIHGSLYQKADDAIEVIFYELEPEFYQSVFLNPYSGKVIQIEDHLSGFFAFVLKGHMRLWLPVEIGEQVVGVSILIFILILISGLVLWVPKKRKNLDQRIKFKWKDSTRWKRKNFDLHAIIGFYICSLALILAFTGSVMSYDWIYSAFYKSIGGEKETYFYVPENKASEGLGKDTKPMDLLLPKLQKESPLAEGFELHYPHSDNESIYVEISNSKGLFYDSDFRYFDQHTLEEIETDGIYGKYKDAKVADKIMRMNYDIHIGAIGGIVGKIIAFLVSLLAASLPVTGILLWYGRTYKKNKPIKNNRILSPNN